ncbi:MAG: glycosyltransferase [Kiritimatiellae bacterium]|nr:glycosyltransferase [Kiritimatiellia bacterium]MDD5521896.1 glycosyltransferase [Kiritimatiellia bacterium]
MAEISVIIPAYNSASTIREAIESVWAQNFSGHEIIVVDDTSTDDTVRIAESVAANVDRRLTILGLDKNSGPAAARNRGMAVAEGKWIAFLDADDAWLSGKLAIQMEYVKQNPDITMVCGRTLPLGDESEKRRIGETELLLAEQRLGKGAMWQESICSSRLSLDDFVTGNPVATSTVLVRRDVVLSVGGFDEQFSGPEDYDLWMRIVAKYPVAKIDEPLSRYRLVKNSLSMDDRKFLPMVLKVLEKEFGQSGVFADRRNLYSSALSNQYWNASWMAFNRGSRLAAIRYWLISYLENINAEKKVERQWFPLLARYVCGTTITR